MTFFGLLVTLIVCCIWGYGTYSIVANKGYDENWFWWGFFFQLFALIFALAKPDMNSCRYVDYSQRNKEKEKDILEHGGWKCSCERVNAAYTGTCGCGKDRQTANNPTSRSILEESSDSAADEIKKYKELLDMGAITQEEFDAKKKQLLNLPL